MARNSVGTRRSRHQRAATTGGTARTTASSRSSANIRFTEIERGNAIAFKLQRPQPLVERNRDATRREKVERRRPRTLPRALRARSAGDRRGRHHQRLADDSAGKRRGTFRRLGVERRQQQRPDQTVVEHAAACHRHHRSLRPLARAAGASTRDSRADKCPAHAVAATSPTTGSVLRWRAMSSVHRSRDR